MSIEYDEMQTKIEAEKEKKNQEALKYINQANSAVLLREYTQRGLNPVYADEDRTIVVSLPMMLHIGWRIEKVNGCQTLTRS